MKAASIIRSICVVMLACSVHCAAAQCTDLTSDLTPTIRALLMLEKPASLTEEQWIKVIENPANRAEMPVFIYKEDSFDPCELTQGWWYILIAGKRPAEKEVRLLDQVKSK
jgi:hypothetical protein